MSDNGTFQLNDIILSIPPEQIRVSKKSFNNQWQTLRTRSSTKVKSGFSVIDIYITAYFSDDSDTQSGNGYDQLLDLISQFKATPFCYIENQYIRSSVLGNNSQQTMALALKQVEISKDNNDTNIISAMFHFAWFNYHPFTKSFSFKKDIFVSKEIKNPVDSNAWKLFYLAEQARLPYTPIKVLTNTLVLQLTEFGQVTVQRYKELQAEVEALKSLNQALEQDSSGAKSRGIPTYVQEKIQENLKNEYWSAGLTRQIFGNMTSMYYAQEEKDQDKLLQEVVNTIKDNIAPDTSSQYKWFVDPSWKVTFTKDGEKISIKPNPLSRPNKSDKKDKVEPTETVLVSKVHTLDFKKEGLIVNRLSISFENILATLPLIGHPYPSYQHIGSIDANINISFSTAEESAIKKISSFYSIAEDQSIRFRKIPSGQRNISIRNDIVNLCGIKEVIAEGIDTQTMVGSPGAYEGSLNFIDNPITSSTAEAFLPCSSFLTTMDQRLAVAKVLEKYMAMRPGVLNLQDSKASLKSTFLKQLTDIAFLSTGSEARALKGIEEIPNNSYFIFKGSSDLSQARLKSLVEAYGREFSKVYTELFSSIQKTSTYIPMERIAALFSLRDNQVIGIERLQEELYPIASLNPEFIKLINGNTLPSSENVAKSLEDARSISDKIIKDRDKLREEQLSKLTEKNSDSSVLPSVASGFAAMSSGFAVAHGQEGSVVKKVEDSLSLVIEVYFTDWYRFIIPFLDKILNSDSIYLPEFASVLELISQQATVNANTCYPDFPLDQVVSLMQSGQEILKNTDSISRRLSSMKNSETLNYGFERLNRLFTDSGLGLKNIGLSALINPDFYFFNPQNDIASDLFPYDLRRHAADAIVKGQESMKGVESDWLLKSYEKKILGQTKTDQMKTNVNAQESASDDINTRRKNSQDIRTTTGESSAYGSSGFAPQELVGSVGSYLAEIEQQKSTPVKVSKIEDFKKDFKGKTYSNQRKDEILKSDSSKVSIRHHFEPKECLNPVSAQEYEGYIFEPDPNKKPSFIWPVDRESVKWDPLSFNVARPGISTKIHNGVDFSRRDKSKDYAIYAAEDGRIVHISKGEGKKDTTYGELPNNKYTNKDIVNKKVEEAINITILHNGGYLTRYIHLKWDPDFVQKFSAIMHRLPLSDVAKKRLLSVRKGQQIGIMGSTGPSTGVHLHFEIIDRNGKPKEPIGELNAAEQGIYKSMKPIIGTDPTDSLFDKSIREFEKELRTGQGYGMVRAYPTFKLFFIESDSGERLRYAFDDFFSYNAVKEIRVVRSRKIAADLCIIQLTNISGVLNNRQFVDSVDQAQKFDKDGNVAAEKVNSLIAANTMEENPLASVMLQTGIQVELRLGYCADDKTEILTKRGWLRYSELTTNDIALTLNHETGLSEWNPVEKINCFNLGNQEMVLIEGKSHSSLTTLNHRWPVISRRQISRGRNNYRYEMTRDWKTSETLKGQHKLIATSPCSDLPKDRKWDDAFVEMMAWFWTEGTIINKGKNRNSCIVISQSYLKNLGNIESIRAALTRLFGPPVSILSKGGKYLKKQIPKWRENQRKDRSETEFRLNREASELFLQIAPDRIVSNSFILELTKDQLALFIRISNKGDGNFSHRDELPVIIAQKDPDQLNALELAAILSGYRTHRYTQTTPSVDRRGNEYYMTQLYICDRATIDIGELNPRRVNYTGVVWCPTTKNHTWLARRNGTVYFTGNSNNPEELDTVFGGVVVDVRFSDTSDLVEIVCQTYAIELVQTIQGEVKKIGGGLFSKNDARTGKLLQEILASPEITHFGRWTGGDWDINTELPFLTNRWRFLPSPQDDNIFAPQGTNSLGLMDLLTRSKSYIMYQTTFWDVVQEMTLRHPGYIAAAVPYKGRSESRMTLFFGLPDQLYFARDPSPTESGEANALRDAIKKGQPTNESERVRQKMQDPENKVSSTEIRNAVNEQPTSQKDIDDWAERVTKLYSLNQGYVRPFRSYHVLTSSLHILNNSIQISAHDAFNAVTLEYSTGDVKADEKTRQIVSDKVDTFTLKADEAILDEEARELFAHFPNCAGYEMAKQYAVSLLFNSLKDSYRGSVIIVGNGKICPYDVCYIFDEYNDMFGPIEVEQVVHVFSQQNGFVSEITPDLMVHVNQLATLSTSDAMGLIAEHALKSIGMESIFGIQYADPTSTVNQVLSYSPFSPIAAMVFNTDENTLGQGSSKSVTGLIGAFIFRKLITRTQLAHPFRFSPLVLGGKPMVAGLPNRRTKGSFLQGIGEWFQDFDDNVPLYLDDLYQKLHPNQWVGFAAKGDIASLIKGS